MLSASMDAEPEAELDALAARLPEVRSYLASHPSGWPELDGLIAPLVREPLGPLAVLPLAAAAAAGGDPGRAVPVAAAWSALNEAVRILDDLQDQDSPTALHVTVGEARAFGLAAGLYAYCHRLLHAAPWDAATHHRVSGVFTVEALRIAAGQDRDLRGASTTLAEHWETIAGKNGRAFALACAAGAAAASEDEAASEACATYGHHLGVALQLFDDLEGIWEPGEVGDLDRGKLGLAVLYGLETEHERQAQLRQIVSSGEAGSRADEVRAILDGIDARGMAISAALEEREAALAALAPCPGRGGVVALEAYVTAIFADLEEIAGEPSGNAATAPRSASCASGRRSARRRG